MVMGDVNGDKTTVLERADTILKDNRIPPEGFTSGTPLYDTVKIVGDAETDPDFNKYSGGIEGSGRDFVHYHINIVGLPTYFKIVAKVYYQSVPPEWLQEMFTLSSPPIDNFRTMYDNADKAPVLVGSDSLINLNIGMKIVTEKELDLLASPTISADGWVNITGSDVNKIKLLQIHNMAGQLLKSYKPERSENSVLLKIPETKGIYLISLYVEDRRTTLKVIRQ